MDSSVFLVTGASGFVGRHVCELLISRGKMVRGLTRRDDPWLHRLGVETCIGDLADPAKWADALRGVDCVIHCAGNAQFGNGRHYFHENVDLTQRLLAAIKIHAPDLNRFVFISTIGAVDRYRSDPCSKPLDEHYPPSPTSDYGKSKLAAEEIVRASGLPFCIVRPAMVVGSDMRSNSHYAVFAQHALSATPFARIRWPGALSVIHVDDLAEGLLLAAMHPAAAGKTFFCAGEQVTVGEYFDLCRDGTWRLPVGGLAKLARIFPWFLPFKLKALMLPVLVASDGCMRQLGWRPRYSGKEALETVIQREKARVNPALDPGGQTVITGAASGLGRALFELLVATRARLLLIDRNREALQDIASRHPNCRILVEDLSAERGVASILESKEWREHPVMELYACAGFGARGEVFAIPLERQVDVFNVNVTARLTLAHATLGDMIRRQFGRVVFISSSSAFQPLPFMAVYSASNAALLFLGEAMNVELAGSGVHVMTVCPGGMKTNFQRTASVKELPEENLMEPDIVARRLLGDLGKGKMISIISLRAYMMSLLARVLPRRLSVELWRRLMAKMR